MDRRHTRSQEDAKLGISCLSFETADDTVVCVLSWMPSGMRDRIQVEGKYLRVGSEKFQIADRTDLVIFHSEIQENKIILHLMPIVD